MSGFLCARSREEGGGRVMPIRVGMGAREAGSRHLSGPAGGNIIYFSTYDVIR